MLSVAGALDAIYEVLRRVLVVAAVVLLVIFTLDWLVRTRRLSPFGPVARFFRRTIDPLIAPVERRVVRAGGLPTAAPWWALVFVVVGGIVLLAVLRFLIQQLFILGEAATGGAGLFAALLLRWTFGLLQLALLVRVISSWFRVSEYSRWIRWSVVLTEWLLRPLRKVVPSVGMVDITPLVAWLLLRLMEGIVMGAIGV